MSNNLGASFTKLPRPPQRPPACRACKRRKSKCDFEQPCSTCMLHSTVDNCCYDTLAVPRDHRSTARICPSAPSRTKQAKTLKARLAEAESMIMAQQHTIESLRAAANTMAQSSTSHSDLHGPNDFRAVQDDAKDREGDDTTGREEDGKTHPEDLADKMTRLVIGSAISPLQLEVPELPNSIATPERTTNGEAQKLQNHVRALLVSHNNGWVEFARRFGLNPSHAAPLPPPPLVSNTIIPEKETINSVHGLVSLFPPTKVEALALLENYLSFVNLVHHVVDGPQTRFEIEFFYDLLLLDPPQPMKPSPMPVPPLLEPGWLSAMLAIFTLADKSDRGGLLRPNSPQSLSDSQRADGKSKIWLEGSLQGLRMRLSGETPLDLVALRSVCLVVWVAISGKTYSPVGERGHDVRLPRSITDRDPIPSAISGLAFRSRLMRQLRKLATLALLPGGISQADAANFEAELDRLDQRLPGEIDWAKANHGYPRFHPIVGGLTLSALMAKSSDPSERRMLFDELSRFTAVIHGYGVLSQVTNLGILAIETALAEVRRGELEPRTLRIPASTVSQAQNEENSTEPYYAAPLIPETVPYDRHQGVEPQSERPPLAPRQSEHIQHPYRPTPIIIPADGLSKQTNLRKQPEVCLQQPANVYDVLLSERVVRRGDSDQVEPASAISPITPSGNDFGQYAITPGQTHVINPIGNLFSHLGGVGYEGLMVGWMGSGISTPATGNQSSETVIPTVQNTWKQEW
ncbi:uncharacterized protein PGTG_13262 [Puccinia graminis f. sp. tritici CRL 75-36-700-3]|uniref:Zn(2)-C6 fungal-type domain-containing protein n=1 Tax=Puccinia graminis f. sp. tritici (strain CRL 75-36-700-3 / race SCCL) TaxID=418459 RepID=E3KRW8_PUCGT|nr:uncharacterized protein PGTG_13262 [Puccinia graminis f. sp. tritici CRL 75-36-700-3]EFP87043.2 hypothetical protein PGTG_13262 [Puccinia graminis f. sp. tritici CRL 75-36-700-3]